MRKSALPKSSRLPSYAPMKKRGISQQRRAALRVFMEARGLSAAGWAKKAGVPASTLQSFLQGRSESLRGQTEQLLAVALGVTVSQMYDSPEINLVPVVGRIGAGAIVLPFEGDQEAMDYVAAPPTIEAKDVVAYEIEGYSMPPFKPGNRVFARRDDCGIPDDCLQQMCIVKLTDGRQLFKIVRRGYSDGRYNLHSLDGEPPIEDVTLEWAARVVGATF
jgi:lambda repressor-like predicted transcriptional regulator